MVEKLAIIMSGGGLKASFGAGAILALAEKFQITEPYLLICDSGSAGTGTYYLSKQYNSIRDIWINLISKKRFLNRKRFWKIIDIDYLVDVICKTKDPLNIKQFSASKTKYLIPALNEKTGKIDYFDKEKVDIFKSMKATKAMPLAFKLNPKIKINDSYYCDSFLSSKAESHIKKAVELGATKILIINNDSHEDKGLYDFFFSTWISFHKFKKAYRKTEKELSNYKPPKNIQIFTIQPKSEIRISMLDNNLKLIRQTLHQGYLETVFNQKLKKFLKS